MDEISPYQDTSTAVVRSGVSWRTLLMTGAIVLIGGGALGSWVALEYFSPAAVPAPIAAPEPPVRAVTAQGSTVPAAPIATPAPPITATQEATLATRLSLLEDRLSRISAVADGASGNAGKAEAMLLALAARRTLDRGLPLGVLESPLRLRFGETQPVAVNAIIAAGRSPVTREQLADQLSALRPQLDVAPNSNLLDRLRAGIDSLIVIRPSEAPSPTSNSRYARAIAALDRDRIDLAIVEIEAMPGANAEEVAAWLRRARLRNDAARALDLIESAAILEPQAAQNDPILSAGER
jgi:hypothetical protein